MKIIRCEGGGRDGMLAKLGKTLRDQGYSQADVLKVHYGMTPGYTKASTWYAEAIVWMNATDEPEGGR